VQTAQRLGPAVGPVIGGVLAGLVGLRGAFIVTAGFYAIGLLVVRMWYEDRAATESVGPSRDASDPDGAATEPVRFRSVLAFENFVLMMGVIFGLQFVDRSLGPVLSLYVEQVGVARETVPLVAGMLFSITACTGALGHHVCGRLLRRFPSRPVIAGGAVVAAIGSGLMAASEIWVMLVACTLLGLGIGAAMTASFSAAGRVIPARAHGAGFGVLTSASLIGMACSPFIAGLLGGTSIRSVFLMNVVVMAVVAGVVEQKMVE
jgi:DHA1 family multidrug resistance protein-like MFS transporter